MLYKIKTFNVCERVRVMHINYLNKIQKNTKIKEI